MQTGSVMMKTDEMLSPDSTEITRASKTLPAENRIKSHRSQISRGIFRVFVCSSAGETGASLSEETRHRFLCCEHARYKTYYYHISHDLLYKTRVRRYWRIS